MADFDFVEVDSAKLYTSIISSLMEYCGEALYPGDERRIFGEALVMTFVALYSEFNDKMKQRTLQYARGTVLDAIGERYNVQRTPAAKASATFRFNLSVAQPENVIIPEGTRITADGIVYFETKEATVIPAGSLYADVVAVCTVGGSAYNGLVAGKVSTLVDLIPYIGTALNVTTTAGGDDGEPYTTEGDNRYRERIRLAPSKLSTAGPESAYRYWALSADADIIDVAIDCPEDEPNTVNIYPLMKGGTLPDKATLQKVLDVLADDVRPMTDKVQALAPAAVEYEINIKYYCEKAAETETIKTIEGEGGAIDQFNEWQTAALGRDINPDQLRRFILAPYSGIGALRVDVVSPSYVELSKSQIAVLTGTPKISHEVVT